MTHVLVNERQEEVYRDMGYLRMPAKRALQIAISRVYGRDFRGNESVLEIGAGEGFLRSVIQHHSGVWVELDQYVSKSRRGSGGELFQASADSLPFGDGSFDAVIGFESINVLSDVKLGDETTELEKLVIESARVLKKSGKFLCLYDFIANKEPLLRHFESMGLPVRIEVRHQGGLTERRIRYIPPEKLAAYSAYVKEEVPLRESPFTTRDVVKDMDAKWERFGRVVTVEEVNGHFNRRLTDLLKPHFESVKSGTEFAFYCGRKTEPSHRARNFHGTSDSRLSYELAALKKTPWVMYSAVKTLLGFNLPCVEIVGIPYVAAHNGR